MIACQRLKLHSRVGLLHDLSKLKFSELIPYTRCFYADDGSSQYNPDQWFDQALNQHQKANKHHWQYWVLFEDSGKVLALPMTQRYIEEMVADWMGAGRAITGKWEVKEWYEKNKEKMLLHTDTKERVEKLLNLL